MKLLKLFELSYTNFGVHKKQVEIWKYFVGYKFLSLSLVKIIDLEKLYSYILIR